MNRRTLLIAAAVAVVLVAVLRPSRYGKVRNLDSRGSSIIAFGDSLTAGYGAGAGEDYPSRLAAGSGLTVINAGVSGDTTASALTRLQSDVLARDPRIVIVGLGGNDFLRRVPIETTEANLRAIVRRIQQSGAMVILLGFRFPSLGPSYETMYERIADEEGCLLVEDLLDGIMGDPSLKSDEIHPNARGYAMMAERVAGPLQGLVEAADDAR
ncbi:MAG TPA: arylesterase [Thermoanaerobaculia bacterium]|nr:arylesterase [Thermoanaerobaculia bacterium]